MASPIIVTTPAEARATCETARRAGARVGLVPTMGALHDGHLALVERARSHSDFIAVSIFVNPTQFGANEDFAQYPRDLSGDVAKLGDVALVFAPEATAMYRRGDATRVRVDSLAAHLCGPFRPGHFEGVATVVSKLFGVIGECAAVFGEKDWQQLAIIRRFVADLFLPVTVLSQPTVREKDGLALSSRNAFLSPSERSRALSIASGLGAASTAWKAGERNAEALAALVVLDADSTDYVAVVDPESLVPLRGAIGGKALIAVACRIGKTRLIDNVVVSSPSAR